MPFRAQAIEMAVDEREMAVDEREMAVDEREMAVDERGGVRVRHTGADPSDEAARRCCYGAGRERDPRWRLPPARVHLALGVLLTR